jgi:hypothetical protein
MSAAGGRNPGDGGEAFAPDPQIGPIPDHPHEARDRVISRAHSMLRTTCSLWTPQKAVRKGPLRLS